MYTLDILSSLGVDKQIEPREGRQIKNIHKIIARRVFVPDRKRARGVFFKAARGRKRCMEKEGGQGGGGCVYEVISCQTQERHFYTLGERVVDKNTKN